MKTLLLDRTAWDLVLDTKGNIAAADDPYSIGQDICAAVRTNYGELWYDTAKGIPYYTEILGGAPALEFLKAKISEIASTVPQVTSVKVVITAFADRRISGQIQYTYTTIEADGSTSLAKSGIVTFIGTNTEVVTFVGISGFPITFTGS
jgi:hypothetical protein